MVLSFSSAAEAMMFSVGWHAVHRTTSVWPSSFCTISFVCRFQMYTYADGDSICVLVFHFALRKRMGNRNSLSFKEKERTIKLAHNESHPMLSSEPDTIHLPPVTLKLANMQYFSFLCPV